MRIPNFDGGNGNTNSVHLSLMGKSYRRYQHHYRYKLQCQNCSLTWIVNYFI